MTEFKEPPHVVSLDPSSGTPIYRQIMDQVRGAVAAGTLAAGDRLPSVRDLALELAVNPNTIAKAYQELERSGVIETLRGKATFVAKRDAAAVAAAMSLDERLRRLEPAVERLLAEGYHLGLEDGEVERLVRRKITEIGRERARGERGE